MGRGTFSRYISPIREELDGAFATDHTPREVAQSFALGTFITMLPTFGIGLLLFVAIVAVFDRVSPIALFASVLVFNPVVKWGVYAASFALGMLLLGPIEGVSATTVSFSAGPAAAVRLLVGNLILAVVATAVSYLVVHRLAERYVDTDIAETVEEVLP
jgi:uncharacterized protein (DUF2062 family)